MKEYNYAPAAVDAAFIGGNKSTLMPHNTRSAANLKAYIVSEALNGNLSFKLASALILFFDLRGA